MSIPESSPSSVTGTRPSIVSTSELARHLKLSRWTVSRAINGHPEVNEATRKRVLDAMKSLQFSPNLYARSLRGGKTGFIGLCLTNLSNPMMNIKVFHLQEFLRRHGYRSLLETKTEIQASELEVIEDFRRLRVEGMVLIYPTLKAAEAQTLLKGLACVQVDSFQPQTLPSVALDRYEAMRLLFEHLFDFGHRQFALLGFGEEDRWRWNPLMELARQRGLDPARVFTSFRIEASDASVIEAGRRLAHEALRLPSRPTAFISVDDNMATGAIQTLQEVGRRVPDDISVTGFNNQDVARGLSPTLTTIEQHPEKLMEEAGKILLEQIALPPEKRGQSGHVLTLPQLMVGKSTGPAPHLRP
jgi:DNA-binding LacI/PurR family transcriptional regulator